MAQVIITGAEVKVEGVTLSQQDLLVLERISKLCRETDATLIHENYECRTGHSYKGDKFAFIVCDKEMKQVYNIEESVAFNLLSFEDEIHHHLEVENLMKDNYIKGYGETEEKAWAMALS